jgi:K+-transporting ATPase c subunit
LPEYGRVRLSRTKSKVAKEIEALLERAAEAPLGGLVGVKMVNVLEMNLKLREHFSSHVVAQLSER